MKSKVNLLSYRLQPVRALWELYKQRGAPGSTSGCEQGLCVPGGDGDGAGLGMQPRRDPRARILGVPGGSSAGFGGSLGAPSSPQHPPVLPSLPFPQPLPQEGFCSRV